MNRRSLLIPGICAVAVAVVASVAVAVAGPEKVTASSSDRYQQLLQRVQALEARVVQLEQRVPIIPPPIAPLPASVPQGHPGSVPENWIPKEFNGVRYYIIPVERPSAPR